MCYFILFKYISYFSNIRMLNPVIYNFQKWVSQLADSYKNKVEENSSTPIQLNKTQNESEPSQKSTPVIKKSKKDVNKSKKLKEERIECSKELGSNSRQDLKDYSFNSTTKETSDSPVRRNSQLKRKRYESITTELFSDVHATMSQQIPSKIWSQTFNEIKIKKKENEEEIKQYQRSELVSIPTVSKKKRVKKSELKKFKQNSGWITPIQSTFSKVADLEKIRKRRRSNDKIETKILNNNSTI